MNPSRKDVSNFVLDWLLNCESLRKFILHARQSDAASQRWPQVKDSPNNAVRVIFPSSLFGKHRRNLRKWM
jgi:hypothetical protein